MVESVVRGAGLAVVSVECVAERVERQGEAPEPG